MRLREAHIPVVLWVCAAAMLHLGGGEQADKLATVHENETKLRQAARGVAVPDLPFELELDFGPVDQAPAALPPESEKQPEPEAAKNPDPEAEKKPEEKKPEPKKPEKKEEAPKKPEEKKPEEKKPEEKKPEEKKPEPEATPKPPEPLPPAPPPDQKKIAVQQHQDEDEAPNPDAKYLAEKNHKVKPGEETHATITGLHENDKNPTPGTHQGPPSAQPGNGDKTVIAQDENRPGEKVSPNVVPKGMAVNEKVVPQAEPPKKPGAVEGDDKPKSPAPAPPQPTAVAKTPQPPSDGKGLTAPAPAAPEVVAGPNGAFTAPAAGSSSAIATAPSSQPPPGPGDGKPKTLPTLPSTGGPKWVKGLGFGAKGEGGKPTISVDEKIAKAAIGMDQLDALKKKEGETKLSMHRGAWKSSSLERWRSAIENYTPGVKPGNQTELGTAAAPWATYLAQIHVRLHPIFADGFVEGLGDLPAGHQLNDKTLITRMEIVMRPDGTIHHLGIVKPSGVTAFDVAALDSVDRAAPFGKAPDAIVSPDGLVYLHWEFHRDEMRCSNLNAYPYVLKGGAPGQPLPTQPPSKPAPPTEGKPPLPTLPGTQMGALPGVPKG